MSEAFPRIHRRPALLDVIRTHLRADGGLDDPAMALPDDEPRSPDRLLFMPGGLDGMLSHHVSAGPEGRRDIEHLARLVVAAGAEPSAEQLSPLYDALLAVDNLTAVIDPLIRAVVDLAPPVAEVAGLATWLASTSPDRAPVKVGLAFLGVAGAPDGSLLHDLGAHEELTLFAAVAFANARPDPEPDLFLLARRVTAWGRIHCVERLRHTTDPEIARWILLDGFRNGVAHEYLALIAATTGDLAGSLADPEPTGELLDAGADIILALLQGGPAGDIDDYPDAAPALARWLAHVERRSSSLDHLLAVDAIGEFCRRHGWEDRLHRGDWTDAEHRDLEARSAALLADPRWPPLIRQAFASEDRAPYWAAEQAARLLGIDAFEPLLTRIEADPHSNLWFRAWAWAEADGRRARILAERAGQLIDLAAIATGPTMAVGLGPGFGPHSALDWSLQALRAHPGLGGDLLEAALASPSVRNRSQALTALADWDRSQINQSLLHRLVAVAEGDPDERLRPRAADIVTRSSR